MVVDAANIRFKIKTLRVVIANTNNKLREAENTKRVLENILPDTPVDTVTGGTMTAARRQELYDSCIVVADNLIAWGNKTADLEVPLVPPIPEDPGE